jgi:small-conductance mechanosensitive channel
MEIVQEILHGESAWSLPVFLLAAVLITGILKSVFKFATSRLRKLTTNTKSRWDDVVMDLIDGSKSVVIFVWTFYLLIQSFMPSQRGNKVLQILVVVLTGYQIVVWGFYVIHNWRETYLEEKMGKDASSASVLGLMYAGIQAVFIVIVVLMALGNLGVDIGALIAGLGVGGIAVALAAQNVLGDLLASLSIVLDKPFVIGDAISVGTDSGVVERIGIKTTRVRATSGEELVFSNKDLVDNRIHNFKKLWSRRVVQNFGVTYAIPLDKLEQIPIWVRTLVESKADLKYDRCHFMRYGNSSLDFELVFFVSSPDYNVYMDLQQKLLIEIMRKFQAEKVEFAFPTQSLFIEKINMAGTV